MGKAENMKQLKILLILAAVPLLGFAQDFNVGERTINYQNTRQNRTVKAELWYPTAETDSMLQRTTELPFLLPPTIRNAKLIDKSFPLIVISHSTGETDLVWPGWLQNWLKTDISLLRPITGEIPSTIKFLNILFATGQGLRI